MTADALVEQLLRLQGDRSYPPVADWRPERTGEIDIVIRKDGTWWHEGGRIKRPGLVKLLASVLRRDDDRFCLVTPVEQMFIQVEDTPFIGVDLDIGGLDTDAQKVVVTTNVGDAVLVDAEHRLWIEDSASNPRPYVHVRGGLNARLNRSVFYRLIDSASLSATRAGQQLHISSEGVRFPLGERL